MTEVEWYKSTTWEKLMVNYKGTELSAQSGHIILALNDTPAEAPLSSGGVKVDVNFSRLHMLEADSPRNDEYSAFHDNGIPTTTKSPIIRYK